MNDGGGRVLAASVLVIDPDPSLAPALQRALRAVPQRSVVVRGVGTLAEGAGVASDAHWDLAVVNLQLPDGEGLTVLDALKAADPRLSVLVLSSGDDDGLARQAVWWGARDFVPRASSVQALAAAVSIAVGSSRSSRRAAGMEASVGALLEGYPDGVVVLRGDTGEVISSNARMDSVLGGASVEELLEGTPGLVVGPTPEEPFAFTTPAGERRWIRVWRTHVEWLSRPAVALTVRDVTATRRRQQQILRLNAMLQGSRNISRLLAQNLPLRETLEGACDALVATGSFAGVLFVVRRQGPRPAQVVSRGFDASVTEVEALVQAGRGLPCQAAALDARGAAAARRPARECEGCPLAATQLGLVLLAPLRFQDEVFGYAAGSLATHVVPAAEERELFFEIMGDLALAMHGRLAVESERRVAQDKRQAEERLRLLFEATPSGAVFLAPVEGGQDYRVTQVNGAAEQLLGQPSQLLVGRRVRKLIRDEATLDAVLAAARRAVPGAETVFLPADPEADVPLLRVVEVTFLGLTTGEVVALMDDVRERAAGEHLALHALKLSRALFESARALLSGPQLDGALRILLQNSRKVLGCETAVLAFYGEPPPGDEEEDVALEEEEEDAATATFCDGDEVLGRALAGALRGGDEAPNAAIVRDGLSDVTGPVLTVGLSPVGDGESAGVLAFAGKDGGFDNNDQRHASVVAELASVALQAALAREDLRRSREELQSVFDNVPLGVALLDRDGLIGKVNTRLTGWFPEAVPGAQVPGWEDPSAFKGRPCPAMLSAVDGRPHQADMVVSKEASSNRYHVASAPLLGPRGHIEGIVVIFDDVTLRERQRESSVRNEGLAKLGALASGIAHEVRGPLTYILLNSRRLAEELPAVVRGVLDLRKEFGAEATMDLPESARALLGRRGLRDLVQMAQDAAQGGEHVDAVVQGLLQFAKAGVVATEPFLVAVAIKRAVKMTGELFRPVARLEWDAPPELWAMGGMAQCSQVLMGLIQNATQAIGPGHPEDHLIRIRAMRVEDRAWITVSDTGPGMHPEVAARIFDPFYTTKGSRGLGVGLFIAHNLSDAMSGSRGGDTAPGRGTRFTIELPASSTGEAQAVQDRRRNVPAGPRPTSPVPDAERASVLLIDDDAIVARSVARQLSGEFRVTVATSSAEGLRLLMEDPTAFDVILCDFLMDEHDGEDVWRAVEVIDPHLTRRMAYLTGAAGTGRAAAFAREVDAPFLSKPPDLVELTETVRYLTAIARGTL